MNRKQPVFLAALLAALFWGSLSARATDFWVVENQSDTVYRVNVLSASATLVGSSVVDVEFGGLGFDAASNLYAWSTNGGGGALYSVDQGTGAFSFIGGSSLFGADTFDIDPTTGDAIAWTVTGELHDVDLGTGGTSLRVALAPSLFGTNSAFGPDGTLYNLDGLNDLYSVDVDTGVATLVGATGLSDTFRSLGYNPDDGFLYTIPVFDATYPLYRIDPTNASAVLVGNVTGLPNDDNQQITMGTFAPVPEPGTLALCLVGGLALAGSAWARRRRSG